MKFMTNLFCFGLLGLVLFNSPVWSQDKVLHQLIQGKKYFWEAKFKQALSSLKQVIKIQNAKKEYVFEGYLYIGFVLSRQNASGEEVNLAFEHAVELDPRRKLDELIIPPDLAERYNRVRNQLVGCLHIDSVPSNAEFVVVYNDSILYNEHTPVLICELLKKNYQILITEEGYEEQYLPLHPTAGEVDTLLVTLNPINLGKKKGNKFWAWIVRGGVTVAASAILYKTVLSSGDESLDELPAPPTRPPRN